MIQKSNNDEGMHKPVKITVDGILDLHTFLPEDVPSLLSEYIRECHEKGIIQLRIIHGKGKGFLLRRVHSLLEKNPLVMDFGPDTATGNWGVTLVRLVNPQF